MLGFLKNIFSWGDIGSSQDPQKSKRLKGGVEVSIKKILKLCNYQTKGPPIELFMYIKDSLSMEIFYVG